MVGHAGALDQREHSAGVEGRARARRVAPTHQASSGWMFQPATWCCGSTCSTTSSGGQRGRARERQVRPGAVRVGQHDGLGRAVVPEVNRQQRVVVVRRYVPGRPAEAARAASGTSRLGTRRRPARWWAMRCSPRRSSAASATGRWTRPRPAAARDRRCAAARRARRRSAATTAARAWRPPSRRRTAAPPGRRWSR